MKRVALLLTLVALGSVVAQKKTDLPFPPKLPDDKECVTDRSDDFLKKPEKLTLPEGVTVAKEAPTVDFLYYPGQSAPGNPWSAWGDATVHNGKFYSAIGDHKAPQGNAFLYEYDPEKKYFKLLLETSKVIALPEGHYMPGKIHTKVDVGSDGCVYCATHRGSTTTTTDKFHYKGDWILRHDLATGKNEIVVHAPVAKHCIPTGFLDSQRLIFYGATAPGEGKEDVGKFFAYDVKNKKLLTSVDNGPARAMIHSSSTGRVYYVQGKGDEALMRYDPAKDKEPVKIEGTIGIRAATSETPQGIVYTVSQGRQGGEPELFAFNVKTEKIEKFGSIRVGKAGYVTSLDVDAKGRYMYYIPGAHGHAEDDGTPVVQYDLKNRTRKVIAFLHPFYQDKYKVTLTGTYMMALDAKGERLFVTWNSNRGGKVWDCCSLTTIHIPASERAE